MRSFTNLSRMMLRPANWFAARASARSVWWKSVTKPLSGHTAHTISQQPGRKALTLWAAQVQLARKGYSQRGTPKGVLPKIRVVRSRGPQLSNQGGVFFAYGHVA